MVSETITYTLDEVYGSNSIIIVKHLAADFEQAEDALQFLNHHIDPNGDYLLGLITYKVGAMYKSLPEPVYDVEATTTKSLPTWQVHLQTFASKDELIPLETVKALVQRTKERQNTG